MIFISMNTDFCSNNFSYVFELENVVNFEKKTPKTPSICLNLQLIMKALIILDKNWKQLEEEKDEGAVICTYI